MLKVTREQFDALAEKQARLTGCSLAQAGAHVATLCEIGDQNGKVYGFDKPKDYTRAIAETVGRLGCAVSQAIEIVNAEYEESARG